MRTPARSPASELRGRRPLPCHALRAFRGRERVLASSGLEPCIQEQEVADGTRRMGVEALYAIGKAIHPVRVRPAQVSALVVLDLLHLVPQLLCLRLIGLADRALEQGVPAARLPMCLVVGSVRRKRLK